MFWVRRGAVLTKLQDLKRKMIIFETGDGVIER